MIRARTVRVIAQDGEQLGIVPIEEALGIAKEADLDLVEVSPNAEPPVCRVMDYGKYKYEQNKKAQQAKKKQTLVVLKEVKMRAKTEEHDLQFKLRNIRKFLEQGNKVKVTIRFRGREIIHPELGKKRMDRIAEELKDIGGVEQAPKLEGRSMIMILSPSSK